MAYYEYLDYLGGFDDDVDDWWDEYALYQVCVFFWSPLERYVIGTTLQQGLDFDLTKNGMPVTKRY